MVELADAATRERLGDPGVAQERLAVSLAEAGAMLDVSAKTVKREILRGRLRAVKVGAQWRVRVAELEDYLKRGEMRGPIG